MRIPYRSVSSRTRAASPGTSGKPPERTRSARTPASPSSATTPAIPAAGTAMTARSTGAGHVPDRPVAAEALELVGGGIERVHRSGESDGPEAAEHRPPDRVLVPAGTHDDDAPRPEDRGQTRRRGRAVPVLAGRPVPVTGFEDHLQAEPGPLPLPLHRHPEVVEHAQHRAVLRQHVGLEPADAQPQRPDRELLQQQRRDALVPCRGVDDRGHLREVAPGGQQLDRADQPAAHPGPRVSAPVAGSSVRSMYAARSAGCTVAKRR